MKKFVSLITLSAVLLSCTACSSGGGNSGAAQSAPQPAASSKAPAPAASAPAASTPAPSADTSSAPAESKPAAVIPEVSPIEISAFNEMLEAEIPDMPDNPVVDDSRAATDGFGFDSNDDGTCALNGDHHVTAKDIVVPTVSPDGDKVITVNGSSFTDLDADSITFINFCGEIDDYAFNGASFKKITFLGGAPRISDSAFTDCKELKELTFDTCSFELGSYSFSVCGPAAVTISNCKGIVRENAFHFTGIESVTIKDSVIELDFNSFCANEHLKSIKLNDSYVKGNSGAISSGDNMSLEATGGALDLTEQCLSNCSLSTVNISDCPVFIGPQTFTCATGLSEVNIDSPRVIVGSSAFDGCRELKKITICDNELEDNFMYFYDGAFQYCVSLESFLAGSGDVTLGEGLFARCPDTASITIAGQTYRASEL